MQRSSELFIREVTAHLQPRMEGHGGLGRIEPLLQRRRVADHADKYFVHGPDGRRVAVLIVAPGIKPDSVADAAQRAESARQLLGPDLGQAVLAPWFSGWHRDRSYAVTPYRPPFSTFKPWRRLQHWSTAGAAFAWLRAATRQTAAIAGSAEIESAFIRPLLALAERGTVPAAIAQRARDAAARIEAGRWQPKVVFAHYDLWAGNLLRGSSDDRYPFAIIDWGTAQNRGHAFYDLIRLVPTLTRSDRLITSEIRAHCEILQCLPDQAAGYLLAALGHLSLDLGDWPVERFLKTLVGTTVLLDRHLTQSRMEATG